MKHFILLIFLFSMSYFALSQGCVAIRNNGSSCTSGQQGNNKGWQLNLNHRYYKSYKHYVGTIEQKQRVEEQSDVRNWQHNLDISVVRNFNSRWSMSLSMPVQSNVRSSKYEHYGNNSTNPNARQKTKSFGIGDMRITGYYWLIDPVRAHKGNIQAGLGIKLPTGEYEVQDYFRKNDSTYVMGPVDQSIQLGDGGTGVSAELNGYYQLSLKIGVYGNLYYMINPREQNGVSTARGGALSTTAIKYFTTTMSVPDQYMARGGVNYMVNKFTFSGGARIEGVPGSDLVGGDRGFRRPGYVISAEPVISYMGKKTSFYFSSPVALQRNRTQSYSDKLRSTPESKINGDAAFANFTINAGISFRL
ncbi:MAG: hypothetical protein ABIU11_03590 [Chitinophagaceae bacterium]